MNIYFSWGFTRVAGVIGHEKILLRKFGFQVAEATLSAKSPQLARWNDVQQIVNFTRRSVPSRKSRTGHGGLVRPIRPILLPSLGNKPYTIKPADNAEQPKDKPMKQPLTEQIQEVASMLMLLQVKIVFAESCTGGLISASLARVPRISDVHCGSAVVYRLETKSQWLGVPLSMLTEPGPVSEPVAEAMAIGVLEHTPEAEIAASITGHLGPNAPDSQDGLVFVGVAIRSKTCRVTEHRLQTFLSEDENHLYPGETDRERRQWAAVSIVLNQIATVLREEYLSF